MTTTNYDELLNRKDVKEAELGVLFDNSLLGVCFVAPDGVIIKVNTTFADLLGYSRKELEGKKSWRSVSHPDDAAVVAEEMEAVAKGEQESYRIHKRYLDKSGNSVYCAVQVNRIEGEDGVFVVFLKQIAKLHLPDTNLAVALDKNGNPYLQPIVPVSEFLMRNWRWVLGTAGPAFLAAVGWAGNTASNYYEVKAKYELQENQIKTLQNDLNRFKSEHK